MFLPDRHAVSPLDGFIHDVDFTRFDGRVGRVVLPVLALVVAIVAVVAGLSAATGAAAAVVVGLVLVIIVWERDRWRAQDVLNWFTAGRRRRWLEDTGGPGPGGDPAAAEIWLGVHRAGTVPQLYRATAAFQTGDSHRSQLELAAMPEATPGDRALKAWVVERDRWLRTGVADTRELRTLMDELPDSDDTATLRGWIAQVEAADLWRRHEPSWLGPLLAARPDARRYKLSVRARGRLWLSRFFAVPVFVILSFALSATGLALGFGRDHVPDSYAQTAIATRGEVPAYQSERVWQALPELEKNLSNASRSLPQALNQESIDMFVTGSLPTLIWETDAIDLASPSDADGMRVWSVEVLLGERFSSIGTRAIVTFDRADGPAYLYVLDPRIGDSLRSALGLPGAVRVRREPI